jgi:cobalt/nickel transport system permease protein
VGSGHVHALYVHEHSRIHRLAPEVKLLATLLFVLGVAITPPEAIWVFAVDAAVLIAVIRMSRIPARFIAGRLVVIVPFVTFAVIIPFIAGGDRVDILGVSVSEEGLRAMWNILAKASLGAAASITLAATTELPDIIKGMGRLKVPAAVTAIASFMIRYLELIVAEMGRMRVAMTARGYDPRWLAQTRPIASSAGALFVRSYERGERVHDAMLARGFDGTIPDLDRRPTAANRWAAAMSPAAISLTLAIVGMATT